MDWRRLRFPIAGEISPSRFRPDRLLHTQIQNSNPKKSKIVSKIIIITIIKSTQVRKSKRGLQCDDIEGDIVTCDSSPNTIV